MFVGINIIFIMPGNDETRTLDKDLVILSIVAGKIPLH